MHSAAPAIPFSPPPQPRKSDSVPLLEKLLTKKEAAGMLSVSERTVERLIAANVIPAVRLGAGLCRIDPRDLRKFIDDSKRRETPA